ncbi:DUF2531 family protein [Salmonella enterica subsp. enterica]|nr:DUF2531 family protein [Salmonella enterica subsp. enterica]
MKVSRGVLLCFCLLTFTECAIPSARRKIAADSRTLAALYIRGAVRKGERWTGILKDSQQKWRRVEEGGDAGKRLTIVRLTAEALTLTTGKLCAAAVAWLRVRSGQ